MGTGEKQPNNRPGFNEDVANRAYLRGLRKESRVYTDTDANWVQARDEQLIIDEASSDTRASFNRLISPAVNATIKPTKKSIGGTIGRIIRESRKNNLTTQTSAKQAVDAAAEAKGSADRASTNARYSIMAATRAKTSSNEAEITARGVKADKTIVEAARTGAEDAKKSAEATLDAIKLTALGVRTCRETTQNARNMALEARNEAKRSAKSSVNSANRAEDAARKAEGFVEKVSQDAEATGKNRGAAEVARNEAKGFAGNSEAGAQRSEDAAVRSGIARDGAQDLERLSGEHADISEAGAQKAGDAKDEAEAAEDKAVSATDAAELSAGQAEASAAKAAGSEEHAEALVGEAKTLFDGRIGPAVDARIKPKTKKIGEVLGQVIGQVKKDRAEIKGLSEKVDNAVKNSDVAVKTANDALGKAEEASENKRVPRWMVGALIGLSALATGAYFFPRPIENNVGVIDNTPKTSQAAGAPRLEDNALNYLFMQILPGQEYDIPGRAIVVGDVNPFDSDPTTGQVQIINKGEKIQGIAINGGGIIYGFNQSDQQKIIDLKVAEMKKIGGNGPSNPPTKVLILDSSLNIIEKR